MSNCENMIVTDDIALEGGKGTIPKGAIVAYFYDVKGPPGDRATELWIGGKMGVGRKFDVPTFLVLSRTRAATPEEMEASKKSKVNESKYRIVVSALSTEGGSIPEGAVLEVNGVDPDSFGQMVWVDELRGGHQRVRHSMAAFEFEAKTRPASMGEGEAVQRPGVVASQTGRMASGVRPQGPMTTQKCKFECVRKTEYKHGYWEVILAPVHNDTQENKAFWEATPNGEFRIGGVKKAVADFYEVGKEYYLGVTPAAFV